MTSIHSNIQAFHDLLLRLQRKRRFISLSHGVRPDQVGDGIGYAEEGVLLILDSGVKKNVRDLSEMIGLERSWMSRITTMLEEQKLVTSEVDPNDRRSKVLELTDKGRRILEELDKVLSVIMYETLKVLSRDEQRDLAELLSKFADGLNADQQSDRRNRHPVDIQVSRISRAAGVFGENVLGSGLSITKLQTLKILARQAEPIQVADLDQLLPFDISTISRTISDFEKRGWIKKQPSPFDKRGFFLLITPIGEATLDNYYEKALPRFEQALKGFSTKELNRMLQLIESATRDLALTPHRGRSNMELKAIQTDEILDKESSALLKRIKIDPSSEDESNSTRILGLFEDGKLKACSRLIHDSSSGVLVDFVITGRDLDNKQCLALARACFEGK